MENEANSTTWAYITFGQGDGWCVWNPVFRENWFAFAKFSLRNFAAYCENPSKLLKIAFTLLANQNINSFHMTKFCKF